MNETNMTTNEIDYRMIKGWINDGITRKKIAERLNISNYKLKRILIKYNIKREVEIDETKLKRIQELIDNKYKRVEIADKLNITTYKLKQILTKYNIKPRILIDETILNKIRTLIKSNTQLKKIAEQVNISTHNLTKILKHYNIERPTDKKRGYKTRQKFEITESMIEEIKKLVDIGIANAKIAKKIGAPIYRIKQILTDYNIERKFTCYTICKPKIDKLIEMRNKGHKTKEICDKIGCSVPYIFVLYKKLNIPLIRHTVDRNYRVTKLWEMFRKKPKNEKILTTNELHPIIGRTLPPKIFGLNSIFIYRNRINNEKLMFDTGPKNIRLYYVSINELLKYLVHKLNIDYLQSNRDTKLTQILKKCLPGRKYIEKFYRLLYKRIGYILIEKMRTCKNTIECYTKARCIEFANKHNIQQVKKYEKRCMQCKNYEPLQQTTLEMFVTKPDSGDD